MTWSDSMRLAFRHLLVLLGVLMCSLSAHGQAPVQIYLDCGDIPAGIGPQTITLRVRLDCPGGPPVATIVVGPIAAGTPAATKADLIRAACAVGSPGNTACAPAVTAVLTDPVGSGARVQFRAGDPARRITNFEVTDATQEPGALKGVNGAAIKWLAIQGTIAPISGGTVTGSFNPTANITLASSETATSAVTRLFGNFPGGSCTLEDLSTSTILDRATLQNASNLKCIRAVGHAGENGVWTQCTMQVQPNQPSAFAGVSQIDDPVAVAPIPSLPVWGIILLTLLIVGAGIFILIRANRRQPAAA